MARRESTLFNMILALSLISLMSAALLGVTYIATIKTIESNHRAKEVASLKKVLPAFDNDPAAEKYKVNTDRGEITMYPAKKSGKIIATAVETMTTKGYSGLIRLMVGITSEGVMYNVEVLEHKETPGLGAKIESGASSFSEQFKGKDLKSFTLKVKKDGGDVDAITASTISSRAYCDAVQFAYDTFKSHARK